MTEEHDPYSQAAKGKLKLKGETTFKKRKKKSDKKLFEQVSKTIENDTAQETMLETERTKAELAFQKMQEKMQTKRILDKASMTHKERVEKFNQHLDSLTEHFDIPKVSWTK